MNWFLIIDLGLLAMLLIIGFTLGWTVWGAFWTGAMAGFVYVRHVENRLLGVERQ